MGFFLVFRPARESLSGSISLVILNVFVLNIVQTSEFCAPILNFDRVTVFVRFKLGY